MSHFTPTEIAYGQKKFNNNNNNNNYNNNNIKLYVLAE